MDKPINKKLLAARMTVFCNEARAELLETINDVMPEPVYRWPPHYIVQLLAPHCGYDARFSIITFLLHNELPPNIVVDWLLALPSYLRDKSAVFNARTIFEGYMANRFSAKVWDMHGVWNMTGAGLAGERKMEKVLTATALRHNEFASSDLWDACVERLKFAEETKVEYAHNAASKVFKVDVPYRGAGVPWPLKVALGLGMQKECKTACWECNVAVLALAPGLCASCVDRLEEYDTMRTSAITRRFT